MTEPFNDRHDDVITDPSRNVLDLVNAAIFRQDDLREMESANVREIIRLRAEFDADLRVAESKRIDAIRAVDAAAVAAAAVAGDAKATALATQVSTSAEAMRNQVAAAAAAAATSLTAALAPIQKDVTELRQVQFSQQGERVAQHESHVDRNVTTGNFQWAFGMAVVIAAAVISYLSAHVH